MISPLNKITSFADNTPGGPRFQVMKDHIVQIGASQNSDSRSINMYWSQKHGLGDNHHVLWSDDNHSTGSVLGGQIYMWLIYNNTAVTLTSPTYTNDTTNPPGCYYTSRITYTDD